MPHMFETSRKVRSRVVYLDGQPRYCEFVLGLPKVWIEAVARELDIDPRQLYLKLIFDGDLLVKPMAISMKIKESDDK